MRINEDFIEQEDIIDDITDTDLSDENPYYIMQDRRPVIELLNDWDCIFYLEIGDYWAKEPNYVKQVEQMVNVYTRQFTDMIGRLPYGVEMSKFIVGSGLNDGEFEHEDTDFSQYKEYLLNQTNDDRGIQKETKMFFGIHLEQGTLNLQKAFLALSQISKIIFRIMKVFDFMILFKNYKWYDTFRIYTGKGIGNTMVKTLEKDMDDACVQVEPNFYGIDRWMDMLCIFAGHEHKEMHSLDYDWTMEEIRKFKDMLRKNF